MRTRNFAWPLSVISATIFCTCHIVNAETVERVENTITMAPVQVVANRPPPMWEFTKEGKKIVLFGSHYPLLRDVQFNKALVERYAEQADVFVLGPGLVVDDSVSLWRGFALYSSIKKAQINPQNKTLKDVLPEHIYKRWEDHKTRYIGRNDKVDRKRPMYAAYELYRKAIKRVDISNDSYIVDLVERLAEKSGTELVDARLHIPVASNKSTAKNFVVPLSDDIACLEDTLDTIDVFLQYAPSAADAWANGDIDRYRHEIGQYPQPTFCWARLTNQSLASLAGVDNAHAKVPDHWIDVVYAQTEQHEVIFSYASARDIMENRGITERLLEDGWRMEPITIRPDDNK